MPFKLLRNGDQWSLCSLPDFKEIDLKIDPPVYKLFFNDVFNLTVTRENEESTCERVEIDIIHSSVRSSTDIPGILVLEGNKTYGRRKNKLVYKCIPDDTRLQPFLIPYEMKHAHFSKAFFNYYVTFNFDNWDDKHPFGTLSQVIGPVNDLESYYEYQLYCKSLNASLAHFQKSAAKAVKERSDILGFMKTRYPGLLQRDDKVYTIDPKSSQDRDDGFSIKVLSEREVKISIYIANVPLWLDALNLWDSFSRRIATIYLPDKKRPMLPSILSDNLCSLAANSERLAFFMDLIIDVETGQILEDKIDFGSCLIHIKENYTYEEPKLLGNSDYQRALELLRLILPKYKYVTSIRDSHDLWLI